MLWIFVFIDAGLKRLVNGKETDLYGLKECTRQNLPSRGVL